LLQSVGEGLVEVADTEVVIADTTLVFLERFVTDITSVLTSVPTCEVVAGTISVFSEVGADAFMVFLEVVTGTIMASCGSTTWGLALLSSRRISCEAALLIWTSIGVAISAETMTS
jgi:hypothetical protein